MAVAKIRPSYEMPPLELTTDMFLNAEPHVHYLPFALDSQRGNSTDDLTDMVVKFPGVGKIRGGLSLSMTCAFVLTPCVLPVSYCRRRPLQVLLALDL